MSPTPDRSARVVAELTQPFHHSDLSYAQSLLQPTIQHLGFVPRDLTADAAFDAYSSYEGRPERGTCPAWHGAERGPLMEDFSEITQVRVKVRANTQVRPYDR